MFDILVNGQLVAIAAEGVTKIFCNALINALPSEISITSRRHVEPAPQAPVAPETEEGSAK
jgi:hypothetical protein